MAKPDKSNLKVTLSLENLISQALKDLGKYLDSSLSDSLLLATSKGDMNQVKTLVDDALESQDVYSNFLSLAALRQIEALFKKNIDFPGSTPALRREEAIRKFLLSERKCRRTNRRLRFYRDHWSRLPKGTSEIIGKAQDIISDIVGPLGTLQYKKILAASGFGPGFTFGNTVDEDKHLFFKVSGPHTVTNEALPYIKDCLSEFPHWKMRLITEGCLYDVVKGNRVTTVAKTAETDRTIAIEPSLNVFVQKGVDTYLKSRLRRVGVDLKDQTRNHLPARLGSMRPFYSATLDLSSASDCVSREVVDWLFPKLWVTLLDALRSPEYTMDKGKTWSIYEKFSSMGNAFTFPIETCIFFAIAKSCTIFAGGDLSVLRVYGDDIIVDPRVYPVLVEILGFLGFSVNLSKSFAFGPFRETCGSDFLAGVDLRPVYVSKIPRNDKEVYNLFNRLLWNRIGFRLHNLCAYLYESVRRPLIGPPELPPGEKFLDWRSGKSVIYDNYFHAPPSSGERFKRYDANLQVTGWYIQKLRFIPKRMDTTNWNLQLWYLVFLLGIPGQKVDSNSRFRRKVQYEFISYWPEPPWRPYLYDSCN